MIHDGGCLCRAVRFSLSDEPIIARTCWCRVCQYLGAGGPTVNVCFPSQTLRTEGEVRWHGAMADSGSAMQRGFCPTCGTGLFSKAESRPDLVFVRAGALDDPNLLAPSVTIWTKAAPAWACIDPNLEQHDGQVPPVVLV